MGYATARIIAPECMDLRLGVPLLLAFIPQNVFYAINSDVLSPVSCGALFLCVLHWLRTATPSFLLGALTGLAMAAAYVTKLSTLPQIAVALIAIVANLGWRIRQLPRATFIAFAALVICSVIPIGSWIFWTKHQFGDLTGSTAKIALLGWTRKPFATGGSIRFLHREVFGFSGPISLRVSGGARLNGTDKYYVASLPTDSMQSPLWHCLSRH